MSSICSRFYFSEEHAKTYVDEFTDGLKEQYAKMNLEDAVQVLGDKPVTVWTEAILTEKKKGAVDFLRRYNRGIQVMFWSFAVAVVAAVVGLKVLAVLSLILSASLFGVMYKKMTQLVVEFLEQAVQKRINELQEIAAKNASQNH